jgi:4-diphosphocytidyl-2-C-methyl-D-erythritol kinase
MKEKAYAKVNIFLKVVGTRGKLHKISSRFMRVSNLYDTLSFKEKESLSGDFVLEGKFGCNLEKNSIYKAYLELEKISNRVLLETFFKKYKVVVDKNIPEFAGLGGGSSNAAAFLNLVNNVLELNLTKDNLADIGSKIGADVPFFIYNYPSANVSGIGEVVELFDEEPLKIETFTPNIECDTAKVYQKFRSDYLKDIDIPFAKELLEINSKDILQTYSTSTLNDLFKPAIEIYPDLYHYNKPSWFFSGSGSTFFKVKDG